MTTAVKLPAVAGVVVNVTVIDVAVAAVTSPIAPLFKVTVLFAGVVSKPNPLITSVAPLAARLATLLVTTGMTVATLTAAPLLRLLGVTTAVSLPEVVGVVESVMVNNVDVAVVTVPTAPRLRTIVLFAAIGSKPTPLIVNEVALAARTVVPLETIGRMEATCTAVPLTMLFVVTMAVRFPADVGAVVKVTLSVVAVAEATVPMAPLLNSTILFAAVVSKPVPLIVSEVTPATSTLELFASTTGTTSATRTAEPLECEFVVTTAVRWPAAVGFAENVTVSEVGVAAVTVPTTPSLNVTVLFVAILSNPNPLIVIVDTSEAIRTVVLLTTGVTEAI